MKKTLLLFCALLMGISGVKADTVTVTTGSALWDANANGTWTNSTSANWGTTWQSSNGKVCVTSTTSGYINRKASQIATTEVTITTPGSEMITGFSLTFTSKDAKSCTIISGLTSETSTGTTDTKTVSVSGIFVHFVKFTVSGQYANVSEFSITYSDLPEKSGTGFYLIKGNYPSNSYLYASSSETTKLFKNKDGEPDETALYFNDNYVWTVDEYDDYRTLYNVGSNRYVSNFTTASSNSRDKNGNAVNLLNATAFNDAEIFTLKDRSAVMSGAKSFKACSKEQECLLNNYTNQNNYVGFYKQDNQGDPYLLIRVYKVTFKAADAEGTETAGSVLVNGYSANTIYVPANTTLSSITGSKYFIGGAEKTETEVKTAVSEVTNDNLVVYVTPATTTITVNFKQGEETIATKSFEAQSASVYNIVSTFGFQSRYMSTSPETVTGTGSNQTIDVTTTFTLPFNVSSNPATEEGFNYVHYLTLNSKYAKGSKLSASLDRTNQDYLWTVGGDYINGFTFYNKGQAGYMYQEDADNSVAAFGGSSTKYFLYSNNDSYFYLQVKDTKNKIYLNDRTNTLSTWDGDGYDLIEDVESGYESYYSGSRFTIEDVESDMSEVYTYLSQATIGSSLNQYSSSSYTDSDRSTALSNALTAYTEGDVFDVATAAQPLWEIKNDLTLNMPTAPLFMRIRSSQNARAYLQSANESTRMKVSTTADKETIFLYDTSTKLISYSKGFAVNNVREMGAVGGAGNTFEIVEAVSGNVGQYSIKCNDGGDYNNNYLYSTGVNDSNADRNTLSDSFKQQNSFTLEAVTSLPVTITSANYATLYSPVALTIPSGVTAYTATISGDKLVLTPVSTTIPKNTGVLLYSATPDTYNFDITDDVDAIDGNAFSGTIATINRSKTEEVYNSYILSGGSNGIGFYRDGSTTLKGFKAFVDATPSGDVKQFLQFDFGDATAIQTISNALQSEDREIYNLAGQRLNSLQRGVNIVNGKKVLVK